MFSLIKIATSFKEINIETKSICSVYYVYKLLKTQQDLTMFILAAVVEPMFIITAMIWIVPQEYPLQAL